jgi:hypothetical protein
LTFARKFRKVASVTQPRKANREREKCHIQHGYTRRESRAQPQARRVALNVQGSSQQGVQSLPAKQAITGTAETQIHRSGSCECFPLVLALPPGGPCEQEGFDITFSGYVTTTQSSTVVFKLYLGASATIGSNTVLASLRRRRLRRPRCRSF